MRHSEDRYRSQSFTLQRCSANIGWGQGGSCTAHCRPSSSAALGRTGAGLRAHCEVWEIRHGCCRLYGWHCCGGPVLTVTCSCPDNVTSLIHGHLGGDMQRDFWLLACGCLSCGDHRCRLGVGRYSGRAHGERFVKIRSWNNGPKWSRRGADNGDTSACLSAQTHGHFGLGAPRCCPADWAHVVPRKDSNLARVHGGALEPAVLTALQHQKHLSFPQLQFILLARRVGKHRHIDCGSLSPTLVAYAGGGSLSGSQRIRSSTDGGLRGRRRWWWESIHRDGRVARL